MALPQLSTQRPPVEPALHLTGSFSELYCNPSIPPSIADNCRRFHPPNPHAHPTDLFAVRRNICTVPGYRFIHKDNRKRMLMFVDGSCINNGTPQAYAGCGVCFSTIHCATGIAHALETDGTPHTSNRAELRAVLLALGLRFWPGEGFDNVIIACDSEYVVKGVCERLNNWVNNRWITNRGTEVKNRDLWEALLKKMREMEKEHGVHVQFWLIPREWNEADKYAKAGAEREAKPSAGPIADDVIYLERVSN